MLEEAPVNIGAVDWPDPESADATVRGMQIKLQRLGRDTEPVGHMTDRRVLRLVIRQSLLEHPHRALPELGLKLTGHDSILLKEAEPNPGRFTRHPTLKGG
ncbi:hypothetical protein [Rathayibacter soli]|uniref:hypothetical protein n=1 Tax=Rathayibacter soli TaxID=3144168 RepID=UPI0027E47BCB|nr:hypothetical protein [Glaciibacter superstes]